MRRSEVADLLSDCAAFDLRTIGEADIDAWEDALNSPWVPNLGYEEAHAAVIAHYRATAERIAPADVLKRVKDTRLQAMSRAIPKAEGVPPTQDYLRARAADSRLATGPGEAPAAEKAREQVAASRRERHAELDGAS